MSIRADFQPRIDEYISDLETFATGAYLREGETDSWEAPYDASALGELRGILEDFLDRLDRVPDDPEADLLEPVVARTLEELTHQMAGGGELEALTQFNSKHADAVLEPEEFDELNELITDAAAATGATDETLAALPVLE